MTVKVLFVCNDNSCRSQMAEGFLRELNPDATQVESAGFRSAPIHPMTERVMSETGIDISRYRSKSLDEFNSKMFDLAITIGETATQPDSSNNNGDNDGSGVESSAHPLSPERVRLRRFWFVPDPTNVEGSEEQIIDAFRATRDLIAVRVQDLISNGLVSTIRNDQTQLEQIIDLLTDGVIAHSVTDRRIVLFNKAAERITGYNRSDVIGRDCHHVFAPDGLCASLCRVGVDKSNLFFQNRDIIPFITRDGTVRKLKITATTLISEGARPGQFLVFIRDITHLPAFQGNLESQTNGEDIIAVSKTMQDVCASIQQSAPFDYPVLIQGESGTGKEMVAHAIHDQSRRQAAPFIPVNCRGIPDHLLESELFGHVAGAIIGANADRKGAFQLADRGTVFLDEVGELSPALQAKLVRVLQDMSFKQVGGEKQFHVDVRVISASNRNLREMVDAGTFREDLFFRMCVMPIKLPRLGERQEDIPFLVEKILKEIERETGKTIAGISHGAMGVLLGYSWPGNVRELVNALRFAVIRCERDQISMDHLPFQIRSAIDEKRRHELEHHDELTDRHVFERRRRKLNRSVVKHALATTKGNKVRAAKLLKVSRATLYRFLEEQTI